MKPKTTNEVKVAILAAFATIELESEQIDENKEIEISIFESQTSYKVLIQWYIYRSEEPTSQYVFTYLKSESIYKLVSYANDAYIAIQEIDFDHEYDEDEARREEAGERKYEELNNK